MIPDAMKAQEPIIIPVGQHFVMHFKPFNEPENRAKNTHIVERRTAINARSLRFRAVGGEVKVAHNYDPQPGPPTKYFQTSAGEYELSPRNESISFTAATGERGYLTLFLELG